MMLVGSVMGVSVLLPVRCVQPPADGRRMHPQRGGDLPFRYPVRINCECPRTRLPTAQGCPGCRRAVSRRIHDDVQY